MNVPATQLLATACAVCARPLTDAVSAERGVGSDCAETYGYNLATYPQHLRDEANQLIHAIAGNRLTATELRDALFRLHAMGFVQLAQRIERRVGRWIAQHAHPEIEVPMPVAEAEKFDIEPLPFALTEGQERAREAVQRVMKTRGFAMCVIAGFAGTGKTTMIRALASEWGRPTIITPTGKASLRVREATGLYASTIHRWLYKPVENEKTGETTFKRRALEDVPLTPSRLIIMDESSMLGVDIWKDVYTTCKQLDLKLVLVGDGFQLPPVQAPNLPPFSAMTPEFAVACKADRVEMTEVLRQAQGSPVIRASMALRAGGGLRALSELPQPKLNEIDNVAVAVHKMGGVTICHRNVTRFARNAAVRMALGIYDEMPQAGEPLLVLKNAPEAGVVNGEAFPFAGWTHPPEIFERVFDRYKGVQEDTRFGATTIDTTTVTLSLEELHGRLEVGVRPIQMAAAQWARLNGVMSGDGPAKHVSANFGYCFTAHKAQGSSWPYVLVLIEPSVRFEEEEGRRWAYTAITRSEEMAAVFIGRI